jgi:hypothetical protein
MNGYNELSTGELMDKPSGAPCHVIQRRIATLMKRMNCALGRPPHPTWQRPPWSTGLRHVVPKKWPWNLAAIPLRCDEVPHFKTARCTGDLIGTFEGLLLGCRSASAPAPIPTATEAAVLRCHLSLVPRDRYERSQHSEQAQHHGRLLQYSRHLSLPPIAMGSAQGSRCH